MVKVKFLKKNILIPVFEKILLDAQKILFVYTRKFFKILNS